MDQLIPLRVTEIDQEVRETVDARDLHAFLEIGKDYSNWIKAQIRRAYLVEDEDFVLFAQNGVKSNKPTMEYFLTLDSAKHIALMSGTDKGREIRAYFIRPAPQHFDVADRVAALGYSLTRQQAATHLPLLGKRIAREYAQRYASDADPARRTPQTTDRFVDGKVRPVRWYTLDDAEWIDVIISNYCAQHTLG